MILSPVKMPIRLLDQSELFGTSKLFAIWFIANFDQLSIDSYIEEKVALNVTLNHCMPIRVLTHKNSLTGRSLIVLKTFLIDCHEDE